MRKKELTTVEPLEGKIVSEKTLGIETVEVIEAEVITDEKKGVEHPNFIESNTQPITLEELSEKNIVPTFGDGTVSTSHQSFIESVLEAGRTVFGDLSPVDIRVSHPINGRVPSALHKKANELLEEDKTLYWQRIGFVSHVVGLTRSINGQTVHLCIGGVRGYNEDKLYGRPCPLKYRIFVSWTCKICTNLMVQAGYIGNLECMTTSDIKEKALELFNGFDPVKEDNLRALENLGKTSITEEQFCKVIGRLRLYQALPNTTKAELGLPNIILGDQAVNAAVRGYVENPNFKKEDGIDLTLWRMLQLFNEAVKQAYLTNWLEKNQNCTDLIIGLEKALNGESQEYAWFLS